MAINFYDVSVTGAIQMVGAVMGVLQKGLDHLGESAMDELLSYRLSEDMLPLAFQLNSVRHHSLGSVQGMQTGVFGPPPSLPKMSYVEFQALIAETLEALQAVTPAELNQLEGKPMLFKMGDFEIPFVCENFAMSFSTPNLMFHATTVYNILRINGVPLGKQDYLGQMRMGH
jgi:hypothetical protein